VQHYFAALDCKRFLLSEMAHDLPLLTVTDMHVPNPAGMLNVLQLLVSDLHELLQFFVCFIHST